MTLTELLVVLTIVSIVTVFTTPAFRLQPPANPYAASGQTPLPPL
jgi:prepilin-type N-terminal cleavage/methylation domain-containing protein